MAKSGGRAEEESEERKGDQFWRIGSGLIFIVALGVGGVDGAGAASRGEA